MPGRNPFSESSVPLQSHGEPPPYSATEEKVAAPSKWNPKSWGLKTKIAVAVGIVAVIIAIICGAYFGVRNNKYPNYSKLNYSLSKTYEGTSFFDDWDYFNTYDPTSGWVHYVDNATAASMNLTYATSSKAVVKVDTSENGESASTGRKSVRITSRDTWNSGLFLFDITHSPYGCGTWPAVWLSDPYNWPTNGEIDVMEGVNQVSDNKNQMTLHTTDNCKMDRKRKMSGSSIHTNCWNGTNDNAGCGVYGSSTSFGKGFNDVGGGVYAVEWRSAGIRIWYFERDSLPDDLSSSNTSATPDPSSWGEASADFPSTDCNIGNHFRNMSIIVNIDLCGDWAGSDAVYTDQDECPGTCTSYVTNNATQFEKAYWEFNSFKVYTANGESSVSSTTAATATTSATSVGVSSVVSSVVATTSTAQAGPGSDQNNNDNNNNNNNNNGGG